MNDIPPPFYRLAPKEAVFVVIDPRGLDQLPRLCVCFEPAEVLAFIAQRTIEPLDDGIVRRLAWPREVYLCSMMAGPKVDKAAGKLGAIVSEQIFGSVTDTRQAVKSVDDMFASQ